MCIRDRFETDGIWQTPSSLERYLVYICFHLTLTFIALRRKTAVMIVKVSTEIAKATGRSGKPNPQIYWRKSMSWDTRLSSHEASMQLLTIQRMSFVNAQRLLLKFITNDLSNDFLILNFYRASICEGGFGSRNSVCPSVRPSVCLSHAWNVTKLNNA